MDRRIGLTLAVVLGLLVVGAGVGSALWMSQPAPQGDAGSADLGVARAAGRSAGGPMRSTVPGEGDPAPGAPSAADAPREAGQQAPTGGGPAGGFSGSDGADAIRAMTRALGEIDVEGVQVRASGQRCDPRPCVLALRISGDPEALEAARQAVFDAAVASVDPQDGQPAFEWSEGPAAMLGYMWVVPNDLTAETAPALETGVRINMRALSPLGGG